ncbi:LysR family transcriptional regulator [Rouxiella silvae]|uniref:LysR family transcriptional regulator n=1 Tax=Rouxiella silvae TaxID=1646373 RepID=A0AA40X6N7_9GAMM|nr:LysR family transcriptional regulator [Rouxiella silvae]MBF6639444.1 LysR family transcriptional regulator [Rouxiella silvae]ORJ21132.1 LysR family transcriptional regulator [Rouxiella silvae]
MDVRTLRYFVEVVRQQSFTRAAEKLFVTQPTISKMLRNLEDELECTLLIREGRRLRLTDSGQALYQRGLKILEEFRQLEAELEDINDVKRGLLRLGVPPMVGTQMAPLIGEFRQNYPGIELIISEFGGLTVQQAVLSGELDLALTALPIDPSLPITSQLLFSHPLCVVVPRTPYWLERSSVAISELAEESILIYNEDFVLYRQLLDAFSAHGFTPKIAARSGQWDFLAAMVQAGMGVAILPEPVCQRLDATRLRWLPLAPTLLWQLGLIWRQDIYLSQSAQAWIASSRAFWPGKIAP